MNAVAQAQRAAALALLLAVLAATYFCLLAPIGRGVSEFLASREARMTALSRDRGLIQGDKATREQLLSIEKNPRWGRLYPTQRPDKAALQLEADVRALIQTPNNPISLSVAPVSESGVWTVLSVKVTLAMTLGEFAELLDKLQRHGKFLQVSDLTVQSPESQSKDANPVLSIQAQVTGLMLTKERT